MKQISFIVLFSACAIVAAYCGCESVNRMNDTSADSNGDSDTDSDGDSDGDSDTDSDSSCSSNEECAATDYCNLESCDSEAGLCTPMPAACPELWAPVCSCDGVTHDNDCLAAQSGQSVDYQGMCDDAIIWCEPDPPTSCDDFLEMGSSWTQGCCSGSGSFFHGEASGPMDCDILSDECAFGCCVDDSLTHYCCEDDE